jgi:RNA polymerase sigma factor (sigma-70 family)
MINIAVCDDSAHSSDIVGALYELAEGRAEVAVDAFKTAVALKNEIKNKRYDIFLLDPDVADAEGLSLAREIKCLFPECDIILMNSSGKYAVEGYSVFAVGYILKPASQKDLRAPFLHALDKYRKNHAQKRGGSEIALYFSELEDCIADTKSVYDEMETKELSKLISSFLRTLPEIECNVFLQRYWHFYSIKEISSHHGFTQSKVKMMLLRTRQKLFESLTKEGVFE